MMNDFQFSLLFRKYVEGSASAAEKHEFLKLVDQAEWQGLLAELVDAEMQVPQLDFKLSEAEKEEILQNIYSSHIEPAGNLDEQRGSFRLWKRVAGIAAAVLILISGVYIYRSGITTGDKLPGNNGSVLVKDVAPGRNTATLRLANGRVIALSETKKGMVTGDEGLSYDDGTLLEASPETEWLSVSTPKGGTYQVTLPDGTRVWLNAVSSITYPYAFMGKERKVEITGEVYFEVVHDEGRPFLVGVAGQVIEDIGTAFNVNSYGDELTVRTTLVEGAVRVSNGKDSVSLRPGQQSQVSHQQGKDIQVLSNADIRGITAWKNGLFKFNRASLQDVMRQLSRWYNLDVKYEGKIEDRVFSGEITRNVNLSQILDLLRFLNLKFVITQQNQQTTITVTQ